MRLIVTRSKSPCNGTGSIGEFDYCAHPGTWYDPTIWFTEPDEKNRYYSRFTQIRILRIFKRRLPVARTDLEFQLSACDGDYRKCCYYGREAAGEGKII